MTDRMWYFVILIFLRGHNTVTGWKVKVFFDFSKTIHRIFLKVVEFVLLKSEI